MKKILAILCMMSFAACILAQSFTYTYRGVDFKCKVKDGVATIVGFNADADKVMIPATVTHPKTNRSYSVAALNLFAESVYYKATLVGIDKGIKRIEDYCFVQFERLQQVYIPSSVEKIGKKVFNSKKMPTFTMPSSISEDDLRNGLAVYPKATAVDFNPVADIDLSAYSDDKPAAGTSVAAKQTRDMNDAVPGSSDIDLNIPSSNAKRENTFCAIIANETYMRDDTPNVKFAAQDGKTFREYCLKTLGVPRSNIKLATNANYIEMKDVFKWMNKIAEVYGNEANFIVYYSGHGVPDEKGNCKLMPVDISINDVDNGYGLKDIYETLGQLTSKSALMVIDACFSGNDRDNVCVLDENHKGIVRDIKKEKVQGNVVVMTAASNTETALVYGEKAHGLFSYYLMKKLQETKGNVTFGELYDYVNKQVLRTSTVVMEKTQTPSVSCSDNLAGSWQNLKF